MGFWCFIVLIHPQFPTLPYFFPIPLCDYSNTCSWFKQTFPYPNNRHQPSNGFQFKAALITQDEVNLQACFPNRQSRKQLKQRRKITRGKQSEIDVTAWSTALSLEHFWRKVCTMEEATGPNDYESSKTHKIVSRSPNANVFSFSNYKGNHWKWRIVLSGITDASKSLERQGEWKQADSEYNDVRIGPERGLTLESLYLKSLRNSFFKVWA